jgi:hypothetical protein
MVKEPGGGDAVRTVVWRRVDAHSLEHFRLTEGEGAAGPRLEGTIVYAGDGGPLEARYAIECTGMWETLSARVEVVRGGRSRVLTLKCNGGRWYADSVLRPELDGCTDIDVSLTPSTNTLPIRRLRLPVGSSVTMAAAWVRFPELTVEKLPQRYTRLDERRYRYESRGGAFTAGVEVDAHGLVVRYGGLWERVGETEG